MSAERNILLVVHTGRDEATDVARRVHKVLGDNGIRLRVLSAEAVDRAPEHLSPDDAQALGSGIEVVDAEEAVAEGCELVLVLGGDGSFLRGAELARNVEIPVLGVNLGRIGFLAEAEAENIDSVLDHLIKRDYRVEERMTLDVVVRAEGEIIDRGWALNEASLEKGRAWACSAPYSKSTDVPCRRSAVTVCSSRRPPDRRRGPSPRAGRSCGPIWRQFWWCPTMLTRCSPDRWSPAPTRPSRSRSRRLATTRWCSATAVERWWYLRVAAWK